MTKVTLNGVQYGGAQVAAFLGAQSVVQRLNHVVPGRWQQQFTPVPAELTPTSDRGPSRLYIACRLTITLPVEVGGPDVDAVYEDVGEMDAGSFAGLKALYSDARKRAGVAAGIGAYLYTSLAPVVLPIGPGDRQVQSIRRQGKSDLLAISAATEQWLRQGYEARMDTPAVKRDLGEILAHGEPETGMGQGEAAEANQPANDTPEGPYRGATSTGGQRQRRGQRRLRRPRTRRRVRTDARSRLAAQAAAAGYPPDVLALIAHATLPAHRDGEQLEDTQIEQVTAAVEVLAQAGYRAESLAEHIADYRRRHGEDWRHRFWPRALRLASLRYRHPDAYGLSPCETDPDRLAQHACPPASTADAARAA